MNRMPEAVVYCVCEVRFMYMWLVFFFFRLSSFLCDMARRRVCDDGEIVFVLNVSCRF
jgi:hypothetical protein